MSKKDSGQVLLVILMVIAVSLTIGLSVVSRSVTDLRISEQEKERARVFSAAEAGLEKALTGDFNSGEINNVQYTISSAELSGGSLYDFGGRTFAEGQTQTLWLVEHNEDGDLDESAGYYRGSRVNVCWQPDSEGNETAVEVSLIYKDDAGEFKICRGGYDARGGRGNQFKVADDVDGDNCGDLNFAYAENFGAGADCGLGSGTVITPYLLRIKPLYNESPIPLAVAAQTSQSFPSQGECWESSAEDSATRVQARVRECIPHLSPPEFFDYTLFSSNDLVKSL